MTGSSSSWLVAAVVITLAISVSSVASLHSGPTAAPTAADSSGSLSATPAETNTDALRTGWKQTYEGRELPSSFTTVVRAPDGGHLVVGGTDGQANGSVAKLTPNGSVEWTRTYDARGDTSEGHWFSSATRTDDGGYLLIGTSLWGDDYQEYGWVVKIGPDGDRQWEQLYDGVSNFSRFHAGVQTDDGDYLLVGYTNEQYGSNQDGWAVKLDANGDVEWQRDYAHPETTESQFHAVEPTNDGYLVVGEADGRAWALELSSSGDPHWNRTYNYSSNDYFADVAKTDDHGHYVLVGGTGSIPGEEQPYLTLAGGGATSDGTPQALGLAVSVTDDGTTRWSHRYANASFAAVTPNATGSEFLVTGQVHYDDSLDEADALAVELNRTGAPTRGIVAGKSHAVTIGNYTTNYSWPNQDWFAAATSSPTGGYLVAGGTTPETGSTQAWAVELTPSNSSQEPSQTTTKDSEESETTERTATVETTTSTVESTPTTEERMTTKQTTAETTTQATAGGGNAGGGTGGNSGGAGGAGTGGGSGGGASSTTQQTTTPTATTNTMPTSSTTDVSATTSDTRSTKNGEPTVTESPSTDEGQVTSEAPTSSGRSTEQAVVDNATTTVSEQVDQGDVKATTDPMQSADSPGLTMLTGLAALGLTGLLLRRRTT